MTVPTGPAGDATPGTVRTGIWLALATALVSGLAVYLNATAVRAVGDPILFTTLKNGVAAAILVAIAVTAVSSRPATAARWRPNRRTVGGLVLIGIIGGGLPFALFFTGLAQASAPSAALIHKTMVVWVALLAVAFLGERIGALQLAAIGVLAAAQLLIQPADGLQFGSAEAMIVLATGFWTLEVLVVRRLVQGVPVRVAAASRMGIGLVVLVAIGFVTGGLAGIGSISAEGWAWIAVTGGLLTAYVGTWYAALKRAPAVTVTAVLTLAAPITAALQLAGTGTVPGPAAALGYGAILAAGLLVAWLGLRRARPQGRPGAVPLEGRPA
jgi:drug/metabolite transporter (DMT)-like permease